jgi:hypothetical protein
MEIAISPNAKFIKKLKKLAKNSEYDEFQILNKMVTYGSVVFENAIDPEMKSLTFRKTGQDQLQFKDYIETSWGERETEDPEFSATNLVERVTEIITEFMSSWDEFEGNAEAFGLDNKTTKKIKNALLDHIETTINDEFPELKKPISLLKGV